MSTSIMKCRVEPIDCEGKRGSTRIVRVAKYQRVPISYAVPQSMGGYLISKAERALAEHQHHIIRREHTNGIDVFIRQYCEHKRG